MLDMVFMRSQCVGRVKPHLVLEPLAKKKKVHFKLLFVMAFEAGVHVVKRLQCATNLNRKC